MIKQCVFDADGNLINVGEWDYEYEQIEIEPAEYDPETGEMIKEAVYEEQAMNPLPDGAYVEDREVEYSDEYGWRLAGVPVPKSRLDVLEESQLDLWDLILFGGE